MNEVKIFNSPQFGEIRTTGTSDNPLFCLADLCTAIGLKDVSRCASRLDDDMHQTHPILDRLGREQQAIFVSEAGMYDVIIRSDSDKAKPFRRWVTSEVLPSIRKTGSYAVENTDTNTSQPTTIKDKIAVAKFLSSYLNLNESSKLLIAKSIAEPLGLPTPDYTPSQSHTQPSKKAKKSTKNLWFSGKMSNFASSYFRSGGMTAEQMRFGIFYALTSIYNGFVPPCYGLMPITATSGVGQRDRRNRFLMSHYNKQC